MPIGALTHSALPYARVGELVDTLVPYLLEGVERGEPVFVAVGPEELAELGGRVGDGGGVTWVDTEAWYPSPAPRLRAFHRLVTDELGAGARGVRLVGEPAWQGAGPPEFVREWARYESILNTVLAPFPVSLVCTYPTARLAPGIVEDAARTHPMLAEDGAWRPSDRFEEPAELVSSWNPPLEPPPPDAELLPASANLATARRAVVERATGAGLGLGRARELALAVDEILANAMIHAGGADSVRTWIADGRVIWQVDDRGDGLDDALAGYRPPATGTIGGRGLWLARQLVDLLQIVPTASGTAVRLHVLLGDR
jgi:anti-sigma regulatory factor (Ser/Thr protein kinase)